ncbi:hypothetical protein NC653_002023 [Populus alba x Populus x berolinensis]|uniref:Uncharacterized protein n=2 Tax=Populus TaxID=3689 RepID=A0A4U5M9J7_POPAL|nr:hypothetical protein NC653_002023 [Populus alba x Populus x berolinensis]TKR65630.1 hypothetical protein D5086_0000319630 [Populus alba]
MTDKDGGRPVLRASQARLLLYLAKVELQPLKSICFFNFSHHHRFAIISELLAATSKGGAPQETQGRWNTPEEACMMAKCLLAMASTRGCVFERSSSRSCQALEAFTTQGIKTGFRKRPANII